MTQKIKTWGARSLTLYGKVTVIKILVLSKIIFSWLYHAPLINVLNKYRRVWV